MFEDMTIGVSARTGDAVSSLSLVANRLDEVGDEADDAADETGELATRMSLLGPVSMTASGGLGTLATTMGSVIVSAGTLAAALGSTLAPLVALGGAGGALAGLVGVGAVTHMNELSHALSDTKTELQGVLEPLGDEFAPLLIAGIRNLDDLTEEVVESIGPLGEFKQTLRLMGEEGEEQIPKITRAFFQLAREQQDELRGVITFLGDNAPGAIRAIGEAAEAVGPETAALGEALADLGPSGLRAATTAGETLLPAMTGLVNAADGALETFNDLPDSIQTLIVWAGALAVPLTKLSGLLASISGVSLSGGAATTASTALQAVAGTSIASIVSTVVAGILGAGVVTFALEKSGLLPQKREAAFETGEQTRRNLGPANADSLLTVVNQTPELRNALSVVGGIEALANLSDDQGFVAGAREMERTLASAQERTLRREATGEGALQSAPVGRGGVMFRRVEVYANDREGGRAAARGFQGEFAPEMQGQNVVDTSSGRSP